MRSAMTRNAAAVAAAAALAGCAANPFVPDKTGAAPAAAVPLERVRHGGGDAAGQYALGKYYLGQQRHALALVAFTKAIAADPGHVEARNGRAAALAQLGDLEAAAAELEAAIQRSPDAAHLHGNLGYVLMQAGRDQAAANALRRAFELDPKNARVRANWSALAAKTTRNPALAAALSAHPVAPAGITPPANPPVVSASAVREVVSASVANLVYAPGADRTALAVATPATAMLPGSTTAAAAAAPATTAASNAAPAPGIAAAPAAAVATAAPARSVATAAPARLEAPAVARSANPAGTAMATEAGSRPGPAARLAIANANGVSGIARRYREALRAEGLQVVRVSNAARFDLARSTIRFRDGHLDAALALSRRLPVSAEILLDNSLSRQEVDVQLVLGGDAARTSPPQALGAPAGALLAAFTRDGTAH